MEELETRLVFIDTSIFEGKNFQFGQHTLKRLEDLLDDERIYLLLTDITVNEIRAHLQEESKQAASAIKKVKKEAMFLRNTPSLPSYGIFEKLTADEIFSIVNNSFDALLDNGSVEVISSDRVNPSVVFEKYFNNTPPFGEGEKKSEFPDAFALEAINIVSRERCFKVYVVSSNGDMSSYAKENDNMIHLDKIDELIDIVVRNAGELKEPAKFADSIFDSVAEQILERAKGIFDDSEYYSDYAAEIDDEVEVFVESVKISNKNLISVSEEDAEYEVEFDVNLTAHYSVAAYDRSPWDPEEKEYVFVLYDRFIMKHTESILGYVTLGFDDGLKVNSEIVEVDFGGTSFELSEDTGVLIEKVELDINGE